MIVTRVLGACDVSCLTDHPTASRGAGNDLAVSSDPQARGLRTPRRRDGITGLLTYLAAWVAAGAAVAAAAVVLLGGGGGGSDPGVRARPVREIVLVDAMRRARCTLRATKPRLKAAADVPARLPTGVYSAPLQASTYERALAHGVIVIEYRYGLAPEHVDQLVLVQRAVPSGTIVAPARRPTRFALRASTYRRVLSCIEADSAALDALQLFRGRFVGTGARRAGAPATR